MNITVISDNANLGLFVQSTLETYISKKVNLRFTDKRVGADQFIGTDASYINLGDTSDLSNLISTCDLVISAHCKKIFPASLIDSIRCVNIHPGYNPVNKGWFPQVFSILNGQIAGATIHIMTSEVDSGPIIAQDKVVIEFQDNAFDVYQKVIELEKKLFENNLEKIFDASFRGTETSIGNFNSISDFKNLCHLDLQSIHSLEYHLRLLRSLTFPGYRNAYVIVGGQKYFIEVSITPETQNS